MGRDNILIAEVGNIRIIDDGFEDEDVYVEIKGNRVGIAIHLEHYENMSQGLSPHFNSALEEARAFYDNGRTLPSETTHLLQLDSEMGSELQLDLSADYTIEKRDSMSNEYIVYFNEESVENDTIVNDNTEKYQDEYDSNWYFDESHIIEL